MQRGLLFALAAALSACAPAPVHMPATQASEVLNLFAAGRGPADVCSADGRALLRGAVRAYSREMSRSGVAWPALGSGSERAQHLTGVDVSVTIAFAAGFVKAGDFYGAPRLAMNELTISQWPAVRAMRAAAREACEEVAALQQAAASFMMETARYEEIAGRERRDGERVRRQALRLQRAHERMQETMAVLEARMRS